MKCTHCGMEMPNDSLFCVNCGTKLEMDMTQQTAASKETVLHQPVAEREEMPTDAETPATEEIAVTEAVPMQTSTESEPRKKHTGFVITVAVGLLAVVVVVVFLVIMLFGALSGGGGNDKMLVYESDETLYYLPNMDKTDKIIELEDFDEGAYAMRYSPSGKYLYLISSDSKKALYRIELSKLRPDGKKNDDYIVKLDNGVMDYQLLDDSTLVYLTSSGKLYYHDGNDEENIDKHVSNILAITEDQNVIYGCSDNSFAYYNLKSKEGDTYAENVEVVATDYTTGEIIGKDNGDIIRIGLDGEETELFEADDKTSIWGISAADRVIYFTKEREVEHSLYDYVDDSVASEDKASAEPNILDHANRVAEKKVMSESDREWLRDYPEDKVYFYDNLYWDSAYGLYTYYNFDDGKYYYYDKTNWYDIDWISYSEAYEAYEAAGRREALREELKNYTMCENYYDLYLWTEADGEALIAENVENSSLAMDFANQMIFYNKTIDDVSDDAGLKKIDMKDVQSIYDVENFYYSSQQEADISDEKVIYVALGAKESALEEEGSVMSVMTSKDGTQVVVTYSVDNENEVYCYEKNADGLVNPAEVDEDIHAGCWIENEYYYTVGDADDGYLMRFKDGDSEKILSDITLSSIRMYADGKYGAYKDGDDRELCIYDGNGKIIEIDDDVESYTYLSDSRIVYVSNENLYVYNAKDEKERIARDVYSGDYLCYTANAPTYDVIGY